MLHFRKPPGLDELWVFKIHEHAGHQPGSAEDRQSDRLDPLTQSWLQAIAADGHQAATIKEKLQPTSQTLADADANPQHAPTALLVKRHAIKNALAKYKQARGRLKRSLPDSLQAHAAKIREEGGVASYRRSAARLHGRH